MKSAKTFDLSSTNASTAPSGKTIAAAGVAALAVILALGVARSGRAASDENAGAAGAEHESVRTCSSRTLRGDYGFTIDGQILGGPFTGLLRGLAMTHFDGHGNLSQVDFATLNGVPTGSDWRPGTGTYEVDANCTGNAEIDFVDGSPALHLRLVVVDGGREVLTIVEGNATGSRGIRVR